MKVTNTQAGPRGVNTIKGPVLVEPGETADVEIFEREKEHLEATGWFTVEGDYTPDRKTDKLSDLNSAAPEASAKITELESHIEVLQERVEWQSNALVTLRSDSDAKAFGFETEKRSLMSKVTELESEKIALASELESLRASSQKQPAPDREALKKQAADLGVSYAHNVTDAKLKELVDAKLASNSGSAS
ncbi:hypothetical protein IFT84_17470 [Rhizobium sp. CFBP 8762]|uniref:hypothetical protein n=1 Tax=Rhizobium sp. CFBP 8762 TaxID=2775279 RepID=UPI001780A8FC|nr:hypothetical protein [Rhizobium sp. CFBP 8762]MBD8556300.1 hypothetical protein [Rhizobium sp. CFBP 8762]